MKTIDEERFGVQLGLLVETSGRLQTSVGRVMRWGLGSVDVVTNESNRDALLRDIDDMKVSMGRVERALMASIGELPVAPVVQGHPGPVAQAAEATEFDPPTNGH